MREICPVCGLPKEICVCQQIAREQQRISVYSEKRKFGKIVTIVEGVNEKELNIKDLAKKLKSKLACGGTSKEGRIELQGKHKERVKEVLIEIGFPQEIIDMR